MLCCRGLVAENFYDDRMAGHDWGEELKRHMMAAYNSDSRDKAFDEIDELLEGLGDPYTRRYRGLAGSRRVLGPGGSAAIPAWRRRQ